MKILNNNKIYNKQQVIIDLLFFVWLFIILLDVIIWINYKINIIAPCIMERIENLYVNDFIEYYINVEIISKNNSSK